MKFPEDRILTRISDKLLCSDTSGVDFSSFDFSGGSSAFPAPSAYGGAVADLGAPGTVGAATDLSGGYEVEGVPQSLDSSIFSSSNAATATENPSLQSQPSTLSMTGGAALNTQAPNPTIYSSGSSGQVASIAGLSSAISQWGFSLANVLGGTSTPGATPTRVITVGSSTGMNSSKLLVFGLLVIGVIIVISLMDE